MRLPVPFASLLVASLTVLPMVAQFPGAVVRPGMQRGGNTIAGTLYGADGSPLGGVEIEVRDYGTNTLMTTVYSQPDGSFLVSNLSPGNYQFSARAQGAEDREVVSSSALNQVELRLKRPRGAQGGADGAISVAQLKVPQKAQDRYNKAREALAKGKYDEAEKQVADSLAICPKNARALTLRGVLAVRKQQTAAAMQDFQSALEVDPNYEPAYTAMGDVYNSQGRFDDAARTTERAVALAPNAWQGYFEMARAYIGKGMYKKGLEVATRAQSLGGADVTPGIHLLKAYAMVPLKLYKDASQELQAFLAHATQGQNTEPVKSLLAQVQAAEAAAATAPAGMAFAPRQ